MIHQIIHPRLDPLRRTEIHPIQLTDCLDLLPRARQADHVRMELFQIGLEHRRCVSCRITRYEEGEEGRVLGIAGGQSLVDEIEHAGHLVEFFGADVRTVREAEVDLVARAGCQRFPHTTTLIRKPQPSNPLRRRCPSNHLPLCNSQQPSLFPGIETQRPNSPD